MTKGAWEAEERMREMFGEPEERELFEDDLNEWETEQVFQDNEGFDEFGDFGIDGMGPDFE
jgi:hypothetical protein